MDTKITRIKEVLGRLYNGGELSDPDVYVITQCMELQLKEYKKRQAFYEKSQRTRQAKEEGL